MDQIKYAPAAMIWNPVVLDKELLLQEADQEQRKAIASLLSDNGLPVSDLNVSVKLFALTDQKRLIGSAGLELYGAKALLRSMSVIDNSKGRGLGKKICLSVEEMAKKAGIRVLYLVTTTAAGFFEKLGYQPTSREKLPADILSSAQFNGVCPATAIIMKKAL